MAQYRSLADLAPPRQATGEIVPDPLPSPETHMTHTFTDAELARLPKWAQSKVNILNMRFSEAQKRVRAVLDNEPSRISIGHDARWNLDENTLRYLPTNRVDFRLGETDNVTVSLHNNDPMRLEVSLNTSGCELHVQPRVSNVLEIVLVPR